MVGCDFLDNSIKIVTIAGPTASGKTRLSVELAKAFNGEIISADSMQIYKGMQIATAKPTIDEKCGITHYLMDFLPPSETYSVAMFVNDAAECIENIKAHSKLPFLVGGTGLYIDSLLNNIKFNDECRDKAYSDKLWQIYRNDGIGTLLDMLLKVDEDSYLRLKDGKNPKRIIRAIEFYNSTGMTITEQIKMSKLTASPYLPIKIGLNARSRQFLYDRINRRVDLMIENGLLEEAQDVLNSDLSFTSIKAIGYKELIPYFNDEKSLDECVEKLKMETRRYAKRQITWFKRDKDINWLYIDEYNSFEELYRDAKAIIERGLVNG